MKFGRNVLYVNMHPLAELHLVSENEASAMHICSNTHQFVIYSTFILVLLHPYVHIVTCEKPVSYTHLTLPTKRIV